jgi:hypothetical protein
MLAEFHFKAQGPVELIIAAVIFAAILGSVVVSRWRQHD